jgi:hypothetical protein
VRGKTISAAALFESREWKRVQEREADWRDKPNQRAYWEYLKQHAGRFRKGKMIFIPVTGGEIFVSSNAHSPLAGGVHADVNAAANIGLRVLMDPDWAGRWWYLPVDRATGRAVRDKLKGCQAPGWEEVSLPGGGGNAGGKSRPILNAWREPSARPLNESAWTHTTQYWQAAEERVFANLLERMRKDDG